MRSPPLAPSLCHNLRALPPRCRSAQLKLCYLLIFIFKVIIFGFSILPAPHSSTLCSRQVISRKLLRAELLRQLRPLQDVD